MNIYDELEDQDLLDLVIARHQKATGIQADWALSEVTNPGYPPGDAKRVVNLKNVNGHLATYLQFSGKIVKALTDDEQLKKKRRKKSQAPKGCWDFRLAPDGTPLEAFDPDEQ
jgi:hypothetical protein